MDHLLALKVMRLSRPSLAAHPQPYFADSTTLAAHAAASPLSLQGPTPLPGTPSTLRDLAISPVLLLPEAFGSISLGETFTSSLCVNNESSLEIIGGHLLVEIQTASNKIVLGEIGGIDSRLQPNQMIQLVVSHEIKELGQHVLACTVSYHVPPALRNSSVPPEDPANPTLRTIRKFYKFLVSNPLSVRTKVHIPRSPTALLNKLERHKVFLEVHVQNLTTKPLHFERIQFECAEGWALNEEAAKLVHGPDDRLALLHPQDLRQYMYILTPTPDATPSFPIVYPPGTIIALGRLDMSWCSSFGEPGRLLTSMLSRKIPLPPAPTAASAIPPHIQRQVPGRPGSPAPYNKRVPGRPQSPAPGRPMSPSVGGSFSGTGGQNMSISSMAGITGISAAGREVEVDLVVREVPGTIYLDKPFTIKCSLGALAALPETPIPSTTTATTEEPPSEDTSKTPPPSTRARLIRLAVQHTHHTSLRPTPAAPVTPMAPEVSSPRALLSALSSPGAATPRVGALDLGAVLQSEFGAGAGSGGGTVGGTGMGVFPPPYSPNAPAESPVFLGSSTRILPPIVLSTPAIVPSIGPLAAIAKARVGPPRGEGWVDFEVEYVCVGGAGRGSGMVRVGGMRVFVVEDRELDIDAVGEVGRGEGMGGGTMVREWDVVGEVWVERAVDAV